MNIIMEMDRGNADASTLGAVRSAAKTLAQYATVIVVLSESNGALEFDVNREPRLRIIWVDAMTNAEALCYAKTMNIALSEEELQRFFDKVGTLPIQINNLQDFLEDESMSLDEIIDEEVDNAACGLAAFPLQKILVALKKSPDGVKATVFKGIKDEGVLLSDPMLVASFMRNNVIKYHFPSKEYRLMTNALKTALLDYEPTVAN